jgi:uncharacterized protein (DUF1697 family)
MNSYVVLLRGINVLGSNLLPMKALAALLEELGCADVRTYIQSGNAVLRSRLSPPTLSARIRGAIATGHGFEPKVLVLSRSELERAAAGNPFPEAVNDPKSLHCFFLDRAPSKPDLVTLNALKTKTERFALKGTAFYLHTPDGFGNSKLAARAERLLGVAATARNWRTVCTLLEMAGK